LEKTLSALVIQMMQHNMKVIHMTEDEKFIIDLLIENSEWSALSIIAKNIGADVYEYIHSHEECPWRTNAWDQTGENLSEI
jgi:hypothetical protein